MMDAGDRGTAGYRHLLPKGAGGAVTLGLLFNDGSFLQFLLFLVCLLIIIQVMVPVLDAVARRLVHFIEGGRAP
jgi:hypothetical protein